ncbi:MAG: carbamoyltransferase C-terminal domain-containing protein [Pseudomonadales bacterium]|jgi:carbamoyltransferase|nr:carbamoyltransferase C-terminal domain-containing protein [Pseudomonadales bacterium]
MNILGINYAFHDSSACVLRDGRIEVAIEEERLTREKHTREFPHHAITRCLEFAGLTPGDVDRVAFSIRPSLHAGRKVAYALRHAHRSVPFLKHEFLWSFFRQRTVEKWIHATWGDARRAPPIDWVPHHLAHAVGSFLVSPWEEAALLSLDGSGEWATSLLGHGRGTGFETYAQSFFPHSLGSVYEAVTAFCGFKPMYDEGKTMGLAPLGDPERFHREASRIVRVTGDGRIEVDLDYFGFQFWEHRYCSPRFLETFGTPREPGAPFEQHHLDVAAAFQRVLEEAALGLCRVLRERTQARHLVVAGGVALNSVMNGRILREAGFDDLYVMPAAGDNGTAIGAASYSWCIEAGQPRPQVHDDPYLGTRYDDAAIRRTLRASKLDATCHEDIEAETARLLRAGRIVGWFQGAMEIGPRALGNRSILADPTRPDMKDRINAEVKHREAFRPFAPAVVVERAREFFDIEVEAPFMLKVCDVLPGKRAQLPAITHVDGSARLQTVRRETNPRFHRLLECFGEASGVPVLLNTSFNVMGEPIVETPVDAIRCFFSTGLDDLVLGNHVLSKPDRRGRCGTGGDAP